MPAARRHPPPPAAAPPAARGGRPRPLRLALSGGNALGAYAAGACAALLEAGWTPELISGASVGAITGAIVAGNPPERRVERLRAFWRLAAIPNLLGLTPPDRRSRELVNRMHAAHTLLLGRPGIFAPRVSGYASLLPGAPPDIGLFDGRPILRTLRQLVDFDRLNAAELPLVVNAVDLERGEAVRFDSRRQRIEPEHLLASTAFIPGFPPVEIDGRLLGDPGLLCNLPLAPLLDDPEAGDRLCLCVDLFDARGGRPSSMDTAIERAQDITFAAQSLRTIEAYRREYRLRAELAQATGRTPVEAEVVLLAYAPPPHEQGAKALEFSAASVAERWAAGEADLRAALQARATGEVARAEPGFVFHDARRSTLGLAPPAGHHAPAVEAGAGAGAGGRALSDRAPSRSA